MAIPKKGRPHKIQIDWPDILERENALLKVSIFPIVTCTELGLSFVDWLKYLNWKQEAEKEILKSGGAENP